MKEGPMHSKSLTSALQRGSSSTPSGEAEGTAVRASD